jgi:lysozyme
MLKIIVTLLLITLSASLNAAQTETKKRLSKENDGLQELVNEPSRADLFKQIVQNYRDQHKIIEKSFNLHGEFLFPRDVIYDYINEIPRNESIFGIDISHYTDSNFPIESLHKNQVKFVYVKATQGTGFKDGKFTFFWKKLGNLPVEQQVHRGAYHFLSFDKEGIAQAVTYINFLKEHGGLRATDMPPVMDLEWDIDSDCKKKTCPDRWEGKSSGEIIASAKAWLLEVEKQTGRKPILYTSRDWWNERIGDEKKFSEFAEYPIWIADYSKSARAIEIPKTPNETAWVLWQFTASASIDIGSKRKVDAKFKRVDANIFKGTEMDFYNKLGVSSFK